MRTEVGRVVLVGAGPGDPELMTIKGMKALQEADVIFYDRLVNNELLDYARADCRHVYVGKRKHLHVMSQEEISAALVEAALAGNTVVRLKGGDPFVFGRGGEELEACLEAGIECQVIPGITAATGAAAALNLPLTMRGESQACTFVTAHRKHGQLEVDWSLVMRREQTVVFYMGLSVIDQLVEGLLQRGKSSETPFCIVANATKENQMVIESSLGSVLETLKGRAVPSPALLVMGATRRKTEDYHLSTALAAGLSR